jgi:hypothetical protein
VFSLIIVTTSCNHNAFEKPIDSDIIVHVEKRERAYILIAETEKEYGCVNYPINYSFSRIGSKIKVKFKYVEAIDVCLTAIGPARCEVDLGYQELTPGVEYDLELKLNRKTNYGSLMLGDSAVITFSDNPNIRTRN